MEPITDFTKILNAVVEVFNAEASSIGYGSTSMSSLPVKSEDVLEPAVQGGVSPMPVDHCRTLAIYVIAQHVLVYDHFAGRHRLMSTAAVGALFGRQRGTASYLIKRGCAMFSEGVFHSIYAKTVEALTQQGVDLWRPAHRTLCK